MLVQPRLLQNDVLGIEMGAEGSGNPKGQRETQSPAREAQTCVLVAESGRYSTEAEAVPRGTSCCVIISRK